MEQTLDQKLLEIKDILSSNQSSEYNEETLKKIQNEIKKIQKRVDKLESMINTIDNISKESTPEKLTKPRTNAKEKSTDVIQTSFFD